MRRLILVLLCGLSAASAAQKFSPDVQAFVKVDAARVALTHVRVIDGTGAAAIEDQTIVLSGGRSKRSSAQPWPRFHPIQRLST